jgi:hypothetical protein
MGKSGGQNIAETINKYFLSLADKLTNSVSSSFGSPSDSDYLPFMEQAIMSKYPKTGARRLA